MIVELIISKDGKGHSVKLENPTQDSVSRMAYIMADTLDIDGKHAEIEKLLAEHKS